MKSKLITYKEINSTNSEAEHLIAQGKIDGNTFLLSEYQAHGRGTANNVWISDPAENLLFSWVVFPAFLSVDGQFALSKAVCLAIRDLLEDYFIDSWIKWPNDIICQNMKIGGVLIENSIMGSSIRYSIIGIGLNVNQIQFPEFPLAATSIKLLSGSEHSLKAVFSNLAEKLEFRYFQLENAGLKLINDEYLRYLYRKGEESRFLSASLEFNATIVGVNDLGELLLDTDEGIKGYGFHEIKMLH
jgi:BirA family biotin operon repressor/biotin-[acetyl-CoA-carboxylase] ligase